jgi:hypothetical protein
VEFMKEEKKKISKLFAERINWHSLIKKTGRIIPVF